MSQFALRLPDSLAESIRRLAEESRVAMNQYMMMTLAKMGQAKMGQAKMGQGQNGSETN